MSVLLPANIVIAMYEYWTEINYVEHILQASGYVLYSCIA
jgi:hypothetical protein